MSFKETQYAFMRHIRDPHNHAFEGIEDRRLAIYRELFFNNIEGFVSSAFPVLKSLYAEDRWLALVRQFFVEHDCQSPYFLQISEEFLNFLANSYEMQVHDPVYMLELAHYEWVELAISIADNNPNEKPVNDVIAEPLYFSSTAWRLSYQYPVQFASVENPTLNPSEAGNHLIIYKDDDHDIQFVSINLITAQLLQHIEQSGGVTFESLLALMAEAMPEVDASTLKQGLMSTLQDLADKSVIVTK